MISCTTFLNGLSTKYAPYVFIISLSHLLCTYSDLYQNRRIVCDLDTQPRVSVNLSHKSCPQRFELGIITIFAIAWITESGRMKASGSDWLSKSEGAKCLCFISGAIFKGVLFEDTYDSKENNCCLDAPVGCLQPTKKSGSETAVRRFIFTSCNPGFRIK